MSDLVKSRVYFLKTDRKVKYSLLPKEHLEALKSAFDRCQKVTERESVEVTRRDRWDDIFRGARYVIHMANEGSDEEVAPQNLEYAYRMLDHAIKAQKPRA